MPYEDFDGPDIQVVYPNGDTKTVTTRTVLDYGDDPYDDYCSARYEVKWNDVFDAGDPVVDLALGGDILNDVSPKESEYITLAESHGIWRIKWGRPKAIEVWDFLSDKLNLKLKKLSTKTKRSLLATSQAIAGDLTISLEVLAKLAKEQGL